MRNFWETCIIREHDILREIKNKREDNGPSQGGGHTGISNPTQMLAMRHLRPVNEIVLDGWFVVKKPEKVIETIRYVRGLANIHKALGPIFQARFVEEEDYADTCKRLKITHTTYNRRVWRIISLCEQRFKILTNWVKRK